jgi:WD40 repeat protein
MADDNDETRQIPPTPGPSDPTMLTPPVSRSGEVTPDSQTVAFTPASGSGVSRPISSNAGASRAAAPAPGVRRIGDYDLESEIARGGMGIVYKARQLSLNRPVAFKMILSGQFASAADVERFHVEAEAAAGLDHPNIVPIYEVGAFEGNHFFTMKLIDGRSMAHEMPRLVKAPRDGVRLLVKVCRAIHYAHQHSILHRDLKPANILLDGSGEPHVTDFGLAKRTGGDSQLTQTGTIVGTPSYMAPEQAAPSKVPLTTAADVYSLGAMLYEILTGRPPFKGDSPLDTLMLVINKEAERPRSINSSADPDLETIALKCLEKDPARRYGSAEALAEDLTRWLEGEPILARPIGSVERVVKWAKRRPAIAALAFGIAVVTVLGIAGVIWQWREAVYQRGQTASALVQVAQEAKAAEAARDQEAAQRAVAVDAQKQEAAARQAADDQKAIAVGALASAQRNAYFNDISLADFEWGSNNLGHVDQLLAAAPASMRGWEWHYLNRLAHMEASSVVVPKVIAMAVDESGGQAVAITADLKAVRVELRAHRVLRAVALEGATGNDLSQTSLSADGSRFAAVIVQIGRGLLQQSTTVWDTATGRALMRQTGQGLMAYSAISLTPDGKRLFTGVSTTATGEASATALAGLAPSNVLVRSRIQVWDASSGVELPSPGFADGRLSSLSFSRDGRAIAVASTAASTTIDTKVLDAANLNVLGVLGQSGDSPGVFSADGRGIVRGSGSGVSLWSASGGAPLWSWKGNVTNVVALSPGGRYLAAALADRSIQILDAATGTPVMRLFGSTSAVAALRFAGSDTELVAADADGVRVFAIAAPAPALVIDSPAEVIIAGGVTPDRRKLLAFVRGTLQAWDLETGRLLYGPPPLEGASSAPTASLSTPQVAQSLAASTGQLTSVGPRLLFTADGRRTVLARSSLIPVGDNKQMRPGLRVFETATGKEVQVFEPPAEKAPSAAAPKGVMTVVPMGLGLDAAGQHAVVSTMKIAVNIGGAPGGQGGIPGMSFLGSDVLVWAGTNPQPKTAITLTDAMAARAHLSPDGRYLVIVSASFASDAQEPPRYRVYEAATGRQIGAFATDRETAPVAFSSDSRLIAAETARHTVTIWDPAHPNSPRVLPENRTALNAIAFSPDGSRIATFSDQGVALYDAASGMSLLTLRESNGPFASREIVLPGRLLQAASTLTFSPDGRQILLTTIAADPKGVRVTMKTWNGAPR